MTDPIINKRAAEALKPFIDTALLLQRENLLQNALDEPVYFTADVWLELIEAFKNPMEPDP
jgi:hypothetical protein